MNAVLRMLDFLEKYLQDNTFLVGNRVTLADLCLFSNLFELYSQVMDEATTKHYVSVTRYFSTLLHQRRIHDVLKEHSVSFKAPSLHKKFQDYVPGPEIEPKEEEPSEEYEETREISEESPEGENKDEEEAAAAEEGGEEGEHGGSPSARNARSRRLITRGAAHSHAAAAITQINARPYVGGPLKKLTEKDLQDTKAMASTYHAPPPTKEKPKHFNTSPHAVRSIQQPRGGVVS